MYRDFCKTPPEELPLEMLIDKNLFLYPTDMYPISANDQLTKCNVIVIYQALLAFLVQTW
jgi:hypothetical protein